MFESRLYRREINLLMKESLPGTFDNAGKSILGRTLLNQAIRGLPTAPHEVQSRRFVLYTGHAVNLAN